MHVEVPKAKNFKEFGGEYLMIVISILTALALEQGLEFLHHRQRAREAAEMMNAELRDNIQGLTDVLAYNEKRAAALQQVREQMLAAFRARTDEAVLMKRFAEEWRPAMQLSLNAPGLRREAWETAVANQSLTWMPRATLEGYAGAYGAIRDTGTTSYNQAMMFLDAPMLLNIGSNIQMGVSNPQEIYRAVNQMSTAYSNFDSNLKALNGLLQKVVAENDGRAGAPAHKGS